MSEDKANYRWELMKLLLQIVWADHEIAAEERRVMLGLAERLGLSPDRVEQLHSFLDGSAALPAPNLGLLRAHRADVLQAAEQLMHADNKLSLDESDVFAELRALLGDEEPA